jgi:WD40 repeat protein
MTVVWVGLSPDGRRLSTLEPIALGDMDAPQARQRLWDVSTGKEIVAPDGEVGAWIPDSRRVLGLANDPTGKLFVGIKVPEGASFLDVLTSPQFKDLPVTVWDARTGGELATLKSNTGFWHRGTGSAAFSPDGTRLATIARPTFTQAPGAVQIWDPRTGKELFRLKGHSSVVGGVAFSPDGKRLATAGQEEIKLGDVATGKELLSLKWDARAGIPLGGQAFFFSRDGTRLFLSQQRVGSDGVRVWDATPLPEKR